MDKEDFYDTIQRMLKKLYETDTDSFEWLLEHDEKLDDEEKEFMRDMI